MIKSEHYKDWKEWNKMNRSSKLTKLAVLFKFISAPTFELYKACKGLDEVGKELERRRESNG